MKKLAIALAISAAAVQANAAVYYVDMTTISTVSGFGGGSFSMTDKDGGAAGDQTGASQTTGNALYDDATGVISWAGSIAGDFPAAGFSYEFANGALNTNTGAFTADFTCTDATDPLIFGGSTCGGYQFTSDGFGGWVDADNDGNPDKTILAPAVAMDLFQTNPTYNNFSTGPDGLHMTFENKPYTEGNEYGQDYKFVFLKGSVAAVPVPAAAWLFGSALVGLAGIGRKRK
jgi:hypothetical protein